MSKSATATETSRRNDSREELVDRDAPDPDADQKPDSPSELSRRSWKFVLRSTLKEFRTDQCTDLAAALTYFGVLALFPGLIALVSLVGVVGQGQDSVDTILQILRDLGVGSVADLLEPTLISISTSSGAGVALVLGLLSSLWSASGYVGAFGRAMNRVYEIEEGRPIWKLRPAMLAVTAVIVVLVAAVLTALVLTGPAASAVGSALGFESSAVTLWSILKWPVILIAVVLVVALLYWATPNIEQPKFRWITVGAAVAVVVWILASVAFGFYVSNFSSYNETYGALAGVAIFLLWLWLTNVALLFGAELDSELERGRQLQAGIRAEREIKLPLRDTSGIEKTSRKEAELESDARKLRLEHGNDREGDPA